MNKKIFTLIRHNFLIKIVALLIAILLWFYLREEKRIVPESVQLVRNFGTHQVV